MPQHESGDYPRQGRSRSEDRWMERAFDEQASALRSLGRELHEMDRTLVAIATRREADAADMVELSTSVSKVRHGLQDAEREAKSQDARIAELQGRVRAMETGRKLRDATAGVIGGGGLVALVEAIQALI